MYHYISYTAEGGGRLLRDPADIREELGGVRALLSETERRIEAVEEKKEELLTLLGSSCDTPSYLSALSEVVDESDALKRRLEGLREQTDTLGEELSCSLLLLRGYTV